MWQPTLLSALGGGEINEATLKNIQDSVGIEYGAENVKEVVTELTTKDLESLIAEDSKKLATMPSGGCIVAAAPVATKKEEKKEPPEAESNDDMGFGLFN